MDDDEKNQRIFELRQQLRELEDRIQVATIAKLSCEDDLADLMSPLHRGDLIEVQPWARTGKVRTFVVWKVRYHPVEPSLVGRLVKKDGALGDVYADLYAPSQYPKTGHMDLPEEPHQ